MRYKLGFALSMNRTFNALALLTTHCELSALTVIRMCWHSSGLTGLSRVLCVDSHNHLCSLHSAHTPSATPSPSSPQQPLKSPSPNCSRSFLRDVTNDLNVTQGKKRVFNLSSAPGNNTGQRGLRGKGRGRANRKKVSPLPTTNC